MTSGNEFMNGEQAQQLDQLNQADRALRSMAELATRPEPSNEPANITDQLRGQFDESSDTQTEIMARSSTDLNEALGGVVLRATGQQSIEHSVASEQNSSDEIEIPAATSEQSSGEIMTLTRRAGDLIDLMLGADDSRHIRTDDIGKLADVALQLRDGVGNRMTPERTDQLHRMVVGVLEGKLNTEIAASLNGQTAGKPADVNNGLTLLRGTFAKIPNLHQLASHLWQGTEPGVTDDVSDTASGSRLRHLNTQAPLKVVESTEITERPTAGPTEDFQRLQERISEELVARGGDAAQVPTTLGELSQSIHTTYGEHFSDAGQDDGSPFNKRFLEFYLPYLSGRGRITDLLKEHEITSGYFQRVNQILPALIATELLGHRDGVTVTEPEVTVPKQPVVAVASVVTSDMMPQKQELSYTPLRHGGSPEVSEQLEAAADATIEAAQEVVEPASERMVYEPIIQNLINAAVDPDSSTNKEWYQSCRAFVQSQSDLLTPEQCQAMWNGILFDSSDVDSNVFLKQYTNEVRSSLAQSCPDSEVVQAATGADAIADASVHLTNGDGPGLKDFGAIHDALGRKHKASPHEVQRFLGAAFAVLCAHAQAAN